MSGLQGPNLSVRKPILGSRGPNLDPRGAPRSKVDEKLVFIFRGGPLYQGAPMANFTPVTRALAVPLPKTIPGPGKDQPRSRQVPVQTAESRPSSRHTQPSISPGPAQALLPPALICP